MVNDTYGWEFEGTISKRYDGIKGIIMAVALVGLPFLIIVTGVIVLGFKAIKRKNR